MQGAFPWKLHLASCWGYRVSEKYGGFTGAALPAETISELLTTLRRLDFEYFTQSKFSDWNLMYSVGKKTVATVEIEATKTVTLLQE